MSDYLDISDTIENVNTTILCVFMSYLCKYLFGQNSGTLCIIILFIKIKNNNNFNQSIWERTIIVVIQ